MLSSKDSLLEAISKSFATTEFTDLVINSGGLSHKVHRVIVCSQSSVLRATCAGNFKEASSGIIDLEDDDPTAVSLMLCFFYTANYDPGSESASGVELNIHAQMCTLADKYDVPALMSLANQRYKDLLAKVSFEDYLSTVSEVYVVPASQNILRKSAIQFARQRLKTELKKEGVKSALYEVFSQVPEYGLELLETFVNSPLCGRCRDCGPNQSALALQARCARCNRGGIYDLY